MAKGHPATQPNAPDESATKTRLLDAAERLFAERGFAGASLRAVTQAAGASVSAANYHFGSKEALLRATLLRRVEPVNRKRIDRLDALESDGGTPSVESILEAFLQPAFEMRGASAENAVHIRQVAARLFADPPELVAALKRDLFEEVITRFIAACCRALPGREREDVAVSFHFTIGILVHLIAGHLDVAQMQGVSDRVSDSELMQRMLRFAAAGMLAEGPLANASEFSSDPEEPAAHADGGGRP